MRIAPISAGQTGTNIFLGKTTKKSPLVRNVRISSLSSFGIGRDKIADSALR